MKTLGKRVAPQQITYHNYKLSSPNVVSATVNAMYYPAAAFMSTGGAETPDFAKLRRSGALLPYTPFVQVEETWAPGGTSWDLTIKAQNLITRNETPLTAVDLSTRVITAPTADPEVLYTRLMAKMGSPTWDALTFAGELAKCIRMFRELLPKVISFVGRYDSKRVADMYLEVRYGLRPIVYDIMAINQALFELGQQRPRNFVRKRVEAIEQRVTRTEVPWGHITYTVEATSVMSTRLSGVSSVIPPIIGINPVVSLWEWTRLSFLVDWIVDVGTFLQGLTSLSAYGHTLCGLGTLDVAQVSITGARITDSRQAVGTVTMGGSYIRTTTTRTPYPGTSMSIPLQFDLDFWKFLDILALASALARISARNPVPPRKAYFRTHKPVRLPDIIYRP